MKILHTAEFPATPDEVFEMLSEPRFQEAKCGATAALEHAVSVERSGDRTIIKTERILPTNSLPDFAKAMVGETLKVGETQDWGPASANGTREGSIDLEIHGTPISLVGTMRLEPGGVGTIQHIVADLKAKIPLVGGKIERAAAPTIEAAIEVEHRTGVKWLAR
jgi:Protein of unknown function (DUF2505)